MLTIQECREHLDEETNKSLSDAEVETIRNDLYVLAEIVIETKIYGNRNGKTEK